MKRWDIEYAADKSQFEFDGDFMDHVAETFYGMGLLTDPFVSATNETVYVSFIVDGNDKQSAIDTISKILCDAKVADKLIINKAEEWND